jgi:hypothetical protein
VRPRLERAVSDVKPFHIWEVRKTENALWWEAKSVFGARPATSIAILKGAKPTDLPVPQST